MDFDEYQRLAARTGKTPDGTVLQLYDLGLGIAGEAGEVAEKLKKSIRDDGATISDERKDALKKEIGDVLWYLSQLSAHSGFRSMMWRRQTLINYGNATRRASSKVPVITASMI